MSEPRFAPGQLIQHRMFGYRGVIADVDPEFSGTEQWYEMMAKSRPPKDHPWYVVLVDGASHTTYVAERHLELDESNRQIEHPALGQLFDRFEGNRYYRSIKKFN